MHVIVIADFGVPSGGGQAVAVRSALSLAKLGVEVAYIHGTPPVDERLRDAGVETVGLGLADVWEQPALKGAVGGIWNRDAASRLAAAVARLARSPTILHLHQWTRAMSPSVLPALLRSGHPVVVTLHDYFIACPNGVYYRFDRTEPCRLVPLSLACVSAPCDPRSMAHKAIRVLRTAATRAAIRGGGFDVIHVSDRGRDTIEPFLPAGLPQHRIDNPVEIARGAPAEIPPGGAVAYVGRLTRDKGADLVAEAAQAAGLPAIFIGVGSAEADIRRFHPGAELLGWRDRAEVDAILRSRVLAVAAPSRWYETGPLTIYEAMAAGLPVVASSRSGAAERVAHGETGYVVEPEPGALAAAFRQLAEPDRARRMGRAAYERYWAAPLTPERHAEHLVSLYDEILHRA